MDIYSYRTQVGLGIMPKCIEKVQKIGRLLKSQFFHFESGF